MAIARLSVKVGKKGKASPHALYIAREGKYTKPSNHNEKLEYTGHGNMPKWAEHDINYFWQCADEYERENGTTYREHIIALPRELDKEQRHELIKDWIKSEIGDKYAYQYAIHNPPAMDGKEQPHCHLMFSERLRDGIERDPEQYFKRYNTKNPEKGGAKKANTGIKPSDRKAELIEQRNRWELLCNQHLEKAGHYQRISMKSLKKQGIEREPFNIAMHQMNKPKVKETYKALLQAKEQEYQARIDIITVLQGTPLVEINRQSRELEIKKQKQVHKQAVEPPKTQQATHIAKTTIEPLKTQNKMPEAKKKEISMADVIEQKREVVERFINQCNQMIADYHEYQLEQLREQAKPLFAEIKHIRNNKPLNPFKIKSWQKDLDEKLERYNEIKEKHDEMKAKGATDDDKKMVYAKVYQSNPDVYHRVERFNKEVSEYDKQQEEMKQQRLMAELEQKRLERQQRQDERANDRGFER